MENLPTEIIFLIFEYLPLNDVVNNCLITCNKWKDIVIEYFLCPQLKIFVKLSGKLKHELQINGWSDSCTDNALVLSLWRKFEPYKGYVMITSGGPLSISRYTEIIDLIDPRNEISNFDLYEPTLNAVGAFLNYQPLICGGWNNQSQSLSNVTTWIGPKTNDNCGGSPVDYIGKCSKLTPMCTKRAWASSIVLNKISKSESLEKSGSTYFEYLLRNNESEILWITGGMQQNRHPHSSTEFVTLSESQLFSRIIGPELPFTIYQHCMIEYDYNAIFLIGGVQNGTGSLQERSVQHSKKTWIVDPTNGFEIKEGPDLNVARSFHCGGKMVVDGKVILFVAGGEEHGPASEFNILDSVEFLDPSSMEQGWKLGPKMPFKLKLSTMVTSPNGQGVILIGGYTVTEPISNNDWAEKRPSDSVIELTAKPFMKWKILEQKLKYPRYGHVTLPIPFKMAFESKENYNVS